MGKPDAEKSFRTAALLGKYLRGELTENEKKELDRWIAASVQNRRLFVELCSAETLQNQLTELERTDSEKGWVNLQKKISGKKSQVRRMPIWKIWWQSAAAIFILGFAVWQVWYHTVNKTTNSIKPASKYGDEVMPGNKKAELVLSNGATIRLDAKSDSAFLDQGSSIKLAPEGIVYSKGQINEFAGWNIIRIPNGGEYKVVLEDGTRVWLNSASSLRYPVRFTGNERRVELTEGEAYFEVAKNKEKPFIVVAARMQVQAVGTAFNVNSYNSPDSVNITTLAEGKIKVTTKSNAVYAEPGQAVKADLNTATVGHGDVESATAWKNGLFIFNAVPFESVMLQLSRWYDVRIDYDRTFSEKKLFTGEINRNVPVSKLLQMMEMTGIATFRIKDNHIVILPYTP